MRRLSAGGAVWGALAVALCALLCAPTARAQESGLPLTPFTWANDTQFEYAIYNGTGDRTATAYYRILKEKTGNKTLYHFKYMGRNQSMSESSEAWVDPNSLHPVRSTRKLVSGGRTLFVDVAYSPGKIVVRHKYAGEQATELDIPAELPFFDFEELMWLPAQFQWKDKKQQTFLNYFNTFQMQTATTVVYRDGMDKITIAGKGFPATRYRFAVGATQYNVWTVDQNGREVPAKIFMDDADDRRDVTFIDLQLNLKAVKASPAAWAAKPLPPPAVATMPQPPAIPMPPPPQPGSPDQPNPDQPTPDQPYPSQPIPDQPYPGQPSPGQPNPDQPNPDQPGPGDQPQQPPTTPPGDNPYSLPQDGGGG